MSAIQQFTTRDVAPAHKAQYWNDMAAMRYAGSRVDAAYGEFSGRMWSWNIGPLAMLRPRTNPCRVTRTPLAGSEENLILHVQCRGNGSYSQRGVTARLDPGDAVLCSTAHPYVIELSRHETLVVEFPRGALEDRLGLLDERLVQSLSGTSPSLRIFHDFLLSLWQQGYREQHHDGWEEEVNGLFFDMLAMALRGADFEQAKQAEPAMASRVRAIVEARLQDPQFSVVGIASACGISVRAVQKVFASMGTTPSAYIQERRLVRAAEKLLAYPEATITQIAFDHGFNDSAYFARCFRRRNGVTPREFRVRN